MLRPLVPSAFFFFFPGRWLVLYNKINHNSNCICLGHAWQLVSVYGNQIRSQVQFPSSFFFLLLTSLPINISSVYLTPQAFLTCSCQHLHQIL